MMDAVESGAVKTVVTKDLSRLGRNYLQVGLFTEITFPKKGVRFIAINDGVDSAQGDNDMSASLCKIRRIISIATRNIQNVIRRIRR